MTALEESRVEQMDHHSRLYKYITSKLNCLCSTVDITDTAEIIVVSHGAALQCGLSQLLF